jgi:hypothetical protein
MSLGEHRRIVSRMEEFVWNHWKRQRPGHLTFRFVTAEGVPVDFSIFLERDEQRMWRVSIERKEVRMGGHPSNWFIFRRTLFAYSIHRVDEKRPTDDDYAPFPDEEILRSGTYMLEFRDREGQVIWRWEPNNTTR